MNPLRKEMLEAIQEATLPIYVGPPDLTSEQMYCLNDLIADHWIEGHALPHSSGTGFACIQIIRIKDVGLQALANFKSKEFHSQSAQRNFKEKASKMKSQIFISYARPDLHAVRSVVRFVKSAGFLTWFDHDDLLAGQDWRQVIHREISGSSLLLLCLSTHAVDRTGFFQKEMRLAIDQAELRPQSKAFVLPVRLNACAIPDSVADWHVLDLFTPRATDRLLTAIADATGEGARAPISSHEDLAAAISEYNRANPV